MSERMGTMSETQRLTDFLLARIAEDEAAAKAVAPLAHNFDMGGSRQEERFTHGRALPSSLDGMIQHPHDPATSPHFSRWEPARVLAECEAKRRIVDWAAPVTGTERVPTDRRGVYDRRPVRHVNEDAEGLLRLLAAPYADHPDYRDEWRHGRRRHEA